MPRRAQKSCMATLRTPRTGAAISTTYGKFDCRINLAFECYARLGPPVSFIKLANPPASVPVANSAAGGPNPRNYQLARHRHSAADIIAPTAAIWAAVKARSTATGDRNCQIGLCLLELSLSALLFNPEQKTFRRLSFLNAWNREILQSWLNDRDSPQVSPWSCAVVRAGLVSPSPGPFFLSKLGR
jgi:hypothetical protein